MKGMHDLQVMTSVPEPGVWPSTCLPESVSHWFMARGWQLRRHQLDTLAAMAQGLSCLVIAPTGGGKTMAGFLYSLVDLATSGGNGLHTLYVAPLKALCVDMARNLGAFIDETGIAARIETRTGDTPQARRRRQRIDPPDILLTTPESVALLASWPEAGSIFGHLRVVIVDEVHELAGTKRGDQLALALTRLSALSPGYRRIGLSATVAEPASLRSYLDDGAGVTVIRADGGAAPDITIMKTGTHTPLAGHTARHAVPDIYRAIRDVGTALVFVNTRSQAERVFQDLWEINEDNLGIALHHGSLAREQRLRVESAMAEGSLRAVVATSTLDLGVDWGAVDLVVQIGAPKGVARMLQRIGRARHRMDEPSRALLVPANRFELLECQAVLDAIDEGILDGAPRERGGLDVLAQHVLATAASGPFDPDTLYRDVIKALPYANLERGLFDRIVDYVATGGYALVAYERFRRLVACDDGTLRIANEETARRFRMNAGTIVEEARLKVRMKNGKVIGEVEEHFVLGLSPGETFAFAGEVWALVGIRETDAIVTRARGGEPRVPIYGGGSFPPTTNVAGFLRKILAEPARRTVLPDDVREWLDAQTECSALPGADDLLVEIFPRAGKVFLVVYPFEGRPAHQTLGMLMTRRMERMGAGPLGFVANDYALAIWSLRRVGDIAALVDESLLLEDLDDWLAESSLLKRSFLKVATVAGLIERQHPGYRKTGRQVTFSTDLIYDVLRRHEPNHVLLEAARKEAMETLLETRRLEDMLVRVKGRIIQRDLDMVSPLALPVMLEVGRQTVASSALDDLIEAFGGDP